MKTTTFSVTILLIFLSSILFAVNPTTKKEKINPVKTEISQDLSVGDISHLAPATPSSATFEDGNNNDTSILSNNQIKEMAPVTPEEASFDDAVSDSILSMLHLSPSAPEEATFEDLAGK